MTFAAPLFLLAALAAAIPIALHMINRQKAKELPFSTLRFLKISVQKTRRRKRIHDMLLMAIRAGVLLLIAAGLARPAVTTLGALWAGTHSAVVIILDNSASMGVVDQDRVRFDTATAAAAQILDHLTDGDQLAVLPTCGPALADSDKLDRTQETARQILGQCRVSYERADLNAMVHKARKLLGKADAINKQIFVITDMQKLSWEEPGSEGRGTGDDSFPSPGTDRRLVGRGARGEGNSGKNSDQSPHALSQGDRGPAATKSSSPIPNPQSPIPIVLVDCNRTPKPNVAVEGLDLKVAVPVAGMPASATVTLLNTSAVARQPRVELLLDGVKEASSPELNVPPEGRTKYDFRFAFKRAGLHRGEVRLVGEDGSRYDDRRFCAMEVEPSIPVAIVRPQRHEIPYLDDAYYLEHALSAGGAANWPVQATTLLASDLPSEPLDKYKVVFCVNLPALNADAAERLRNYVAAGGNVMWICGDNVVPEAYNRMNELAKSQLLPGVLLDIRTPNPQDNRDSWHIAFLDKKHPALEALAEPATLYESVLIYKHLRMSVDKDKARVLARLDDGEPLLASQNVERGKVLLWGATAHANWSNLPLRPIFLPLVARLTFDLAEAKQKSYTAIAGQPLVLPFPNLTQPAGIEVVPPSGETFRLKTQGVEGKGGQVFRYAGTHDIGVYLLRPLSAARSTTIPYCVNFDPDEPNPATIERPALQELLGPGPLLVAENPDDLSSTLALLREGKSLWTPFLAMVLLALVFETFLSNRLSPKQTDQASEQLPPGLRRLGHATASSVYQPGR
jgi:hypothetical protein